MKRRFAFGTCGLRERSLAGKVGSSSSANRIAGRWLSSNHNLVQDSVVRRRGASGAHLSPAVGPTQLHQRSDCATEVHVTEIILVTCCMCDSSSR